MNSPLEAKLSSPERGCLPNRVDSSTGSPSLKPPFCPLHSVRAGAAVRVRQLCAPVVIAQRLREAGLGEGHVVKLISAGSTVICLACAARMALSTALAEMILVEPA